MIGKMSYAQLALIALVVSLVFGGLAAWLTYLDSIRTSAEISVARADTAKAQENAALANERTGHLALETEGLRAQAAADQVKAAGLEREAAMLRLRLEKTRSAFAGRDLSDAQMEKLKVGLAGRRYRILLCYGADPEARIYAIKWEMALSRAGQSLVETTTPCGGMTFNGAGKGSPVLYVRDKDARSITDEPLWKAVESMGFILGFSSQSPVPNLDMEIDAAIELPSRAPPLISQIDK